MLLFPVLVQNAFAQEGWKEYSWDYYNIEFELPVDFEVTTNTEVALEAVGDGIRFALYPFDKKDMDTSELPAFIVNLAETELNLSEIDDLQLMEIEGMSAGYISGQKDGLMYLVLGLMDPESNYNFYAFVAFEEDKAGVIEDAMGVFESFSKID
ncbi:hypothetical protein N6H18_09705 [Reichenbachiella agarivorans]|uniref:PsbP C-terminal domain-containing protein n=1 Tax=Reichenbachiella agarivorans TaxID=2979464 RepID=A0ABY6CLP3_9BACT|nr:hypothetical protein [Reichenbachiella agarivorans]UXP30629.1 hypothetical protein N6H18_09705 [Reichenbachiella agarivorans]